MKPRLSLLSVALTLSLLGSEQTTDSPPEKIGFHAVHVDRSGHILTWYSTNNKGNLQCATDVNGSLTLNDTFTYDGVNRLKTVGDSVGGDELPMRNLWRPPSGRGRLAMTRSGT